MTETTENSPEKTVETPVEVKGQRKLTPDGLFAEAFNRYQQAVLGWVDSKVDSNRIMNQNAVNEFHAHAKDLAGKLNLSQEERVELGMKPTVKKSDISFEETPPKKEEKGLLKRLMPLALSAALGGGVVGGGIGLNNLIGGLLDQVGDKNGDKNGEVVEPVVPDPGEVGITIE